MDSRPNARWPAGEAGVDEVDAEEGKVQLSVAPKSAGVSGDKPYLLEE